jgi:hypothetical protein
LCLLQQEQQLLLELFVRIPDLSGLHAGEPLGNDVQQHYLGLPGLRQDTLVLTADLHGESLQIRG